VPPTSWESLAVLRLFLAAVVLAGHATWLSSERIAWASTLDMFGGKAAVVGFLLVSGYSIGSSVQHSQRQFYLRRMLRIYPLYFFAIVYTIAVQFGTGGKALLPGRSFHSVGWKTALGNLVLVQSFLVKPIDFDGPVWSLSVEVFYYLLAPLFVRLPYRYLVGLTAASAICSALPLRPAWGFAYLVVTKLNAVRYLWCWLLGFILWHDRAASVGDVQAGRSVFGRVPLRVPTVSLMVAGSALAFLLGPEPLCIATYLISLGVILAAPGLTVPRRLRKAADYLGDLSYPLYLYHLPTFILAYALLALRRPWMLVACACLVSVFALHVVDGFIKRRYLAPWLLGSSKRTRAQARVVGS
jgi:peptidoglycan/LPS O-acetylase OafA/YrhL